MNIFDVLENEGSIIMNTATPSPTPEESQALIASLSSLSSLSSPTPTSAPAPTPTEWVSAAPKRPRTRPSKKMRDHVLSSVPETPTPRSLQNSGTGVVKTRMCKFVLSGKECLHQKHGKECRFAHSEEELRIPDTVRPCRFGERCVMVSISGAPSQGLYRNKDRVCRFLHPHETHESFSLRMKSGARRKETERVEEKIEERIERNESPLSLPDSEGSEGGEEKIEIEPVLITPTPNLSTLPTMSTGYAEKCKDMIGIVAHGEHFSVYAKEMSELKEAIPELQFVLSN